MELGDILKYMWMSLWYCLDSFYNVLDYVTFLLMKSM